ncbi:HIT family protein [Candidatus Puniceispirillum sp.]|nr:HIT family protein [Candidatus Puniceispirillum sp.]
MEFFLHPTLEKETIFVARTEALQIRLVDDGRYFWFIIIPETAATELHELDEDIAASLWAMARHLGGALKTHCDAIKINTAAIGNMVPQLHVHIVARHDDDDAWPQPIWGRGEMQSLNEETRAARLSIIQSWLGRM